MANTCNFSMKVIGEKASIKQFYNALIQNGNLWIGRGADCEIIYEDESYTQIDGICKWSIQSALIDNAISMKKEPEKWYFGKNESDGLTFITLIEASEKWNLDIEVFSKETGFEFMEHYLIRKGEVEIDDCIDYQEIWVDEYETKEEAEEDLDTTFTDEEWENRECGYIQRGGVEWDFEI